MMLERSAIAVLIVLSTVLNACDSLGTKQGTILGSNVPGIGDLYAPTKDEKADEAWWDKFYGHKSSDE